MDEQEKERLDTAAALAISAVAKIVTKLQEDEDLAWDRDQLSQFSILVLVRAAGWLIGFAGADPNDVAHIKKAVKAYSNGLRVASTDPLTGEVGRDLTARVQKSLLGMKGLNLDPPL